MNVPRASNHPRMLEMLATSPVVQLINQSRSCQFDLKVSDFHCLEVHLPLPAHEKQMMGLSVSLIARIEMSWMLESANLPELVWSVRIIKSRAKTEAVI